MKKSIKKAGDVFAVFCVLLLLWMVFSFVEVNTKNLTENPTYHSLNCFVILDEVTENTSEEEIF